MASSEENRNVEVVRSKKSPAGKIVVVVLLLAAVAFFAKPYLSKDTSGAQEPQQQARQVPSVIVYTVENADLATGREYIGKVEAIQSVALKPQVSGVIAQVHFKEGSIVKAGQLLFTLDSKEYQATVALRKADLAKVEANYDRAQKYYDRLKAADERSVPASDLEIAESEVLQGKASIEQAKASLQLAQIDLGYTRITAPISGQIGKAAFTKGNYVTPSSGSLANIVQVNPIRVAFALPDKDYLGQLEAFKSSGSSVYDATIRLSDGKQYPFSGDRDFEDNTMDDRTGTIMMRLRVKNDKGILIPGSMVRVATKPAKSHVSPVMPQEAILADAGGDYVYVVDANNVARQQRVSLGAEIGSMREVLTGLKAGEQVIVRGLQSVRPEMQVNPTPMRNENETKTPAEIAMESGNEAEIVSGGNAGTDQQESPEGKK